MNFVGGSVSSLETEVFEDLNESGPNDSIQSNFK